MSMPAAQTPPRRRDRAERCDHLCRPWLTGIVLAAAAIVGQAGPAGAAGPTHLVVAGPTWPAPMRVGVARAVGYGLQPVARRRWCDYAAHGLRLQPLPLDADPVFRRPAAAAKARLRQLEDAVVRLAVPFCMSSSISSGDEV